MSQLSVEQRIRRLRSVKALATEAQPKPRIRVELALIGISTVLILLIWPQAEVATTDYPEAREIADHLEAVLDPVWQGDTSIEDLAIPDDLRLQDFQVDDRTIWVLTHAQTTEVGTCYGIRTGGGLTTVAAQFVPTDGCVPRGPFAFEESGSWTDVLPRERATPFWFVPAVGVLAGSALAAASSIVMKRVFR